MRQILTSRQARLVMVLPRAQARFWRRREAWVAATVDEPDFRIRIAHPTWSLVRQANDLLLHLAGGLD